MELSKERLEKILSETQAVINDCNRRCVDGSVEVDARLFESVLTELQLQRHRLLVAEEQQPVRNPVLAYADAYRDMAKQRVESVPIWSVITDLERNIAPLYLHPQQGKAVQVPDELLSTMEEVLRIFDRDHEHWHKAKEGIAALRAAMLTSEPVICHDALSSLIEGMEVSVDVSTCDSDAGHRYFGTVTEVSELDGAKHGYILLVQDAKPNFKSSVNSPVIPDGWVACGERMPEAGGDMIVFADGIVMSGISYDKKKGFYIQALEYDDDETVDSLTHWMPLPAAPKPEVK